MPHLWYTSAAGMVVPDCRWPTTPATCASHIFCATVVAWRGSPASSSAISLKCTGLPPITGWLALISSIAMRTPFSTSLPTWAMPPDMGPTVPISTSTAPAAAVVAEAGAEEEPEAAPAAGAASCFEQAASDSAAPRAHRDRVKGMRAEEIMGSLASRSSGRHAPETASLRQACRRQPAGTYQPSPRCSGRYTAMPTRIVPMTLRRRKYQSMPASAP